MGLQPFYGKGPQLVLLAGSRAVRGKMASVIPIRINYCVMFAIGCIYILKCRGSHNTIWRAAGWKPTI
jgi:hypothetical protein